MYITVLNAIKGSCFSWLELKIKHWDLSLAQLNVPHFNFPSLAFKVFCCHAPDCTSKSISYQQAYQNPFLMNRLEPINMWLKPHWFTLPGCSFLVFLIPISVGSLILSLCLQLHKSCSEKLHHFQICLWKPGALLHSPKTLHWHVWPISFHPLILRNLSNIRFSKFYLMDWKKA